MTIPQTNVDARKIEAARDLPVVEPATDIYETDSALVVVADMPGVAENGLEVTLENQVLTLFGRTAAGSEPATHGRVYREFGPTEYRRTFTINDGIDREKITARLKNGVLRVTLPKAAQAQPRRIVVQSEG